MTHELNISLQLSESETHVQTMVHRCHLQSFHRECRKIRKKLINRKTRQNMYCFSVYLVFFRVFRKNWKTLKNTNKRINRKTLLHQTVPLHCHVTCCPVSPPPARCPASVGGGWTARRSAARLTSTRPAACWRSPTSSQRTPASTSA